MIDRTEQDRTSKIRKGKRDDRSFVEVGVTIPFSLNEGSVPFIDPCLD